jgi:hypothetical protein
MQDHALFIIFPECHGHLIYTYTTSDTYISKQLQDHALFVIYYHHGTSPLTGGTKRFSQWRIKQQNAVIIAASASIKVGTKSPAGRHEQFHNRARTPAL